MNNGDTVVTYIDYNNQYRYRFGEVLAVLGLFPELGDRSGPSDGYCGLGRSTL